jgi:hypothetical protein
MIVSFIVMYRTGNEKWDVIFFYVLPSNIVSIYYNVINYEISVAMRRKMFALNL